ncbi:MAG: TIM barrel protein, partial [Actinobacteria bacterium]|nr:TIM barrel protein [Actinomycetota bacterium]
MFLEPINRYEINFINTMEEGYRFIEKVAEDNLLLLIDTFHMNIEEPSTTQSIKNFGSLIGHIHIADSNRKAPGLGHIDFLSIIAQLMKINYRSFLSAEIIP